MSQQSLQQRVVNHLLKEYEQMFNNSGYSRYFGNIHSYINGNRVTITAGTPLQYVNYGRGAGKRPPKDAIIAWIQKNNIQSDIKVNSLAFLIARKIGRDGTVGKHFIKDIDIKSLGSVIKGAVIDSWKDK